MLLSHPEPEHVHIVPTARDPSSGLALSSRNAYLTKDGLNVAPTLYKALRAAERTWNNGSTKAEAVEEAIKVVEREKAQAHANGNQAEMRLDYVELNNSADFEVIDPQSTKSVVSPHPVILSGALWVDKTRLIDNLILGDAGSIVKDAAGNESR